jgi:hypothetical protein
LLAALELAPNLILAGAPPWLCNKPSILMSLARAFFFFFLLLLLLLLFFVVHFFFAILVELC